MTRSIRFSSIILWLSGTGLLLACSASSGSDALGDTSAAGGEGALANQASGGDTTPDGNSTLVSVGGSGGIGVSSMDSGGSTPIGGSDAPASGGTAPGTSSSAGGSSSIDGADSGGSDGTQQGIGGGPTSAGGWANGAGTGGAETSTGGAETSTGGAETSTGGAETSTGGAAGGPGQGLSLYYVRHAETLANVLEDPSQMTLEDGDTFTELGMRQVEALTNYFQGSGLDFDAILVSPAWRAQKTVEPYLVASGQTGEIWLELTECCGEAPTGGPLPTEPSFYEYWEATIEGENLAFRDDARANWRIDTYEEGLFMVMAARDAFLEEFSNSGLTVLISGHAVSGSILMGLLAGEDMTQGEDEFIMNNRLFMKNTGIQHLEQDPTTGLFEMVDTNLNSPPSE